MVHNFIIWSEINISFVNSFVYFNKYSETSFVIFDSRHNQMNKLTLPVSVAKLIELIGDQTSFKASEITRLIREANIKIEDLKDFEDFDHDKREGYGRKIVYRNDHFEILVMSWAPGDYTAIHNHGYTKWGAVQTFGKLEHVTFELNGEKLMTHMKEKLGNHEIIPVNQDLIHQMGNPFNQNTLSLHVYGTPHKVDGITDNSELYEIGKGEIQLVNGGVFYDLPKSSYAVTDVELTADRLTMIGHYIQLLNYYHKAGIKGDQYQKAVNYFHDRSFESRLITELEMDNKSILYLIELKKARNLLRKLEESTGTIDSILLDINDPDTLS